MKWLENTIEWLIFQSRWLLAPVYLGLVAALALLSFKFLQELVSYAPTIITSSSDDTILAVLSLVDLVLVGNLIILVIFAGYENFVSKYYFGHLIFYIKLRAFSESYECVENRSFLYRSSESLSL